MYSRSSLARAPQQKVFNNKKLTDAYMAGVVDWLLLSYCFSSALIHAHYSMFYSFFRFWLSVCVCAQTKKTKICTVLTIFFCSALKWMSAHFFSFSLHLSYLASCDSISVKTDLVIYAFRFEDTKHTTLDRYKVVLWPNLTFICSMNRNVCCLKSSRNLVDWNFCCTRRKTANKWAHALKHFIVLIISEA